MENDTAQRLRIAVGRLSRYLRPTEAGQHAGLTPTKTTVLLYAVRCGRVRLSEVAEREGLNPTLLSRTVANLCELGLVERTADDEDRRAGWIEPTAAGKRLAEKIRRQRTAAVEAALGELPEADRETLSRALPALEALAEVLAP
jgi:DNA-binding MarR family transcriptional regulator